MRNKIRGHARKVMLQIHRLNEFEKAFDDYLNGLAPVEYVRDRARKMLEIGLPDGRGI